MQSKEKRKRDWLWGQKYGLLKPTVKPKSDNTKRYLIHCASMGEVISAMPLLAKMLAQNEGLNFVLTTNTLTGKEQALKLIEQQGLHERIFHTYLPVDLPWLMRGLIKRAEIDKVIIMEVELWPNLILSSHALNKPVVIINGRMTDSSYRGYKKFSWLAQPMFAALEHVFVRNTKDFDNYTKLGVTEPKLELLGNVKFDISLPAMETAQKWQKKLNIHSRPVIVAGSTHDTEEAALLTCFQELKAALPDLLLIIAPRHPHRFSEVTELVAKEEVNYIQTSLNQVAEANTDVIVLDQMGVLSEVYSVADVVFIGGSIAKRGGHNPIEASAFAKPVLMGEYIYNNPEIIDTLSEEGGLIKVSNQTELLSQLKDLLANPEYRKKVGQQGLATVQKHSGVIAKLTTRL